jgi:hypothetical protein
VSVCAAGKTKTTSSVLFFHILPDGLKEEKKFFVIIVITDYDKTCHLIYFGL